MSMLLAMNQAAASRFATARPAPAARAGAAPRTHRRSLVAVRAQQPGPEGGPPTPAAGAQPGTVFFAGTTYTEEQWKDAVARNEFAAPPSTVPNATPMGGASAPSVMEVMGFSGSPEIINGRLAMLGFVAALGAELSSGDSIVKQLSEEPTLIGLTFVLFSAGSLVPAFARRTSDTLGPFTPQAEMLNGRAAMIGFASMLVLEGVRQAPLFV